uniref:Uncharacterized protein n=2 Tax=Chrysotila carterae TaxID=13221 RepID=A0A6S9S5I7_CHRCT|eukprot:6204193-Pleurochrysis_carterae.AAC.2
MAFNYGVHERVVTISEPELEKPLVLEQTPEAPTPCEADGTGRRIWPTALALSRYLCAHPDLVRGKSVVELGAGSGAAGLTCAALGARQAVLTDMPDALPLIEHNVRANQLHGCSVTVHACTWGNEAHLQQVERLADGGAFDVVLACEVIYKQSADVLEQLAATQQRLAHTQSLILVAYEFRGSMLEDFPYFEAADELFHCEPISLRPYEDHPHDDGEEDYRYLYIYRLRRVCADE